MDRDTLIAMMDTVRQRLLGSLETIEKSGQNAAKVLAWRPGPGRATSAGRPCTAPPPTTNTST